MGAHSARQTSTVGKVAGRGALTAAAALALTGGTASFAFAAEAPTFDNTEQTVTSHVTELAEGAQELPETDVPTTVKGGEELVGGEVSAVEHATSDIASAATSDLQTNANAAGIPVGSQATDTEREIAGQVSEVSGQVHDATGAGAAQLDEAAAQGSSVLSFGGADSDD
ncbi:hypothetical protein PHK61_18360 [Actinomycetospora lutea]|uniref:hypothetical protein n=1 Tax=Actinomycetospora lutea TaxID=663604 RepID=UPI002366F3A0|nr:hypothetical protein [Actinomycetospora lutea]MDD7940392.1 hypothetical protein [Actinomycetospora lutea]